MVKCRHCMSEINGKAKVCPHCRKRPKANPAVGCLLILVGFLIILIGIAAVI